ncbi:sarcosine oxidase subunit alpha family protein [Enterovibrio sp. ZSDZ35]|uniref:Sarcosine oxidase subunit alpha family protein n=1 Tax=Enterovibrio qingdaonensis TaxID=2899818 RepID=A0ABT5QT33_9GAMM|nr:sarcosine oxidase subunit alpha family protein [Enterovibrio sp. ZSDZ35]MDD1783660.1 sarcosine oxidase subunit alpha family protein [Enterovibrio sp. ZSDZ35]
MSQSNRLPDGGRIDRDSSFTFTFNDMVYQGHKGDTLASALMANGVKVVGRSFKYHRPRGILGAGAEEPNAILQVGSTPATQSPNMRATQTELFDGLDARVVNAWPSLETDAMSFVGKLGGSMMPAGFYYKTFMYPESLWPTYEKHIRNAAGLGEAPTAVDANTYDKMQHHCDVLIVGAGAAGLVAARQLVGQGLRIILVDEQSEMGGSLLHTRTQLDASPATDWVADTLSVLEQDHDCMLLPKSTAFGYYDHNFVGVLERKTDHIGEDANGIRQRIHHIRAKQVLLATGAIERPLVFGNNDLPGCMLASAVSTYLRRYAVTPGESLVLMTTNDDAYDAAIDWHLSGLHVEAIVDSRPHAEGDKTEQAKALGITVLHGHGVTNVQGSDRVTGAEVAPIDKEGRNLVGPVKVLACDVIASSGGWSPTLHLSCHTGSRPVWREDIAGFVPANTVEGMDYAGSVSGEQSLLDVMQSGFDAAERIASSLGLEGLSASLPVVETFQGSPAMHLYLVPNRLPVSRAPKQFVDFQNDVTAAGIELAVREGYESIEHIKRYTAMGFGTDQGKTGNINGMAIAANAMGKSIEETGTTIFRPMYTPVTFGALAGRDVGKLFDPERYTAIHAWHIANGAKFENVGQWKRPWYYPKGGETMGESLARECKATRESVGILDASTLGKIDIQGKDARAFLNRIYTNGWDKLAPGKCRYGLMCHEDGMVFDDGVTSCISDDHFLMTTTSGGAAGVLRWLELWHQTEWPEMEIYFTSVTDQWATMTISGPNSRNVLKKLVGDEDVSEDAMPFMSWKPMTVAGIDARVFRISFTGELSFEINVNANFGMYVWQQVMNAGEEYDITPYGTETMHILRAEKGFIIVGQDTDGSVTPQDLNMGWITGKQKTFSFIGRRSWEREDSMRTDRKQLVGLKCTEPSKVIPEGAQAVDNPEQPIPMTMVGHVTSSYYSTVLGCSIALGLIKNGLNRMGDYVYFPLADGTSLKAQICSSVFYDVKNEKPGKANEDEINAETEFSPILELPLSHIGTLKPSRAAGVHLHEHKGVSQVVLRGEPSSEFCGGVEAALGVALPTMPCSTSTSDTVEIWWQAPDEWLVISRELSATQIEQQLRANVYGHLSVTDVSGGQTLLTLSGSHAIDVLKKSTTYDVDDRHFHIGRCIGTSFAKAQVFLKHSSENTYELIVRRSFSDYVGLWIQDAADEYGIALDC